MRQALQWVFVQQQRLLQAVINLVVHIFYNLGIANGLQQSNQSMQQGGIYLHTLSSKQSFISEGWFDTLPDDWRLDISDTGWTTDEIGMKRLAKLFIPTTNTRTKGTYRMLILHT